MIDIDTIDRETPGAIAAGHRIFQTHKFADTDERQADYLLRIMAPPQGSMVLDAGCGIGEVSRLMSARRPDLAFILMNLSMAQLALCPTGDQFMHALDDCQRSLLNTNSMDCAMYSSALCQMDIEKALREAHRVLKDGGILLINDLIHIGIKPDLRGIGVQTMELTDLYCAVIDAGFTVSTFKLPSHNDSHFKALAQQARVDVSGIVPVIIRAVARKENQHVI